MEKLQLMKDAKVVIYPAGDSVIKDCIRQARLKGRLVPCPTTGNAYEDNESLCRAACREMGLDDDTIEERLRALEPVAMRLEVKDGQNDCRVVSNHMLSTLNLLTCLSNAASTICWL